MRLYAEGGHQPYPWEKVTAALPPKKRARTASKIPPGKGLEDPDLIRSALAAIPPDCEYQPWLAVGMALHYASGGGMKGFTLWDEWSAQGDSSRDGVTRYKWGTFGHYTGSPATLGTLFHLAQEYGWKSPRQSGRNGHDTEPPHDYSDYPEWQGLVRDKGADGDASNSASSASSAKESKGDGNDYPPLPCRIFTFEDFMTRPPPAPFIITGFMPQEPQDVGINNATGGTGKSTFELFRAVHIILGMPFLNLPIERPGPVLYVTGEDGDDRIHRRLFDIMEAMHLTPAQKREVADNFRVIDLCEYPLRLVTADRFGTLIRTPLAERLIADYRGFAPVIIYFDPFVRFSPGEEYGNDGADQTIGAMLTISRALNCATLGVHHVSKVVYRDGIIDHLAGRGASSIGDGARCVYSFLQVNGENRQLPGITEAYQRYIEAGELMALFVTKLTDAKKPKEPFIIRRNGWTFELLEAPTAEQLEAVRKQAHQDKVRQALAKLIAYLKEWSFRHHTKTDLEEARNDMGLSRRG